MPLFKRLATVFSAFLILCTSAIAQTGEWRVIETSGTVRIAQTMAGIQLVSTGESLRAGSVLSTGFDGRAVLARGEQSIVVGPNSRMSLPAAEDEGMTRILQDLGTLMFKVDKRGKQHFRVETPVIAAVVKGTTFTVTAGVESHAVHVAEGLVEVTSLKRGESVLVAAGETVQVSTADYDFLTPTHGGDQESGDSLEFAPSEDGKRASLFIPDGIGFEPLDYAGLTDGLVRTGRAGAPVIETAQGFDGAEVADAAAAGVQTASYNGGGASGAGGGLDVSAGGVNIGANFGGGSLDVGASAGGIDVVASVGSGGIDAGASVGGAVDVGASVGAGGVDVTAGVGGADVGASVGSDGVDVGLGVGGVDVGAEVGGGGIDVGVDVGDVADAGVDVGSGGIGVDAGVGGAVDAGVDVGSGGVDVDLGVGGIDVGLDLGEDGLDLDLGLGGRNPDEGSGLLGGLFNR